MTSLTELDHVGIAVRDLDVAIKWYEDMFGATRDVRVSVPTFHSIGGLVQGTALIATVPTMVAQQILRRRSKLRIGEVPFPVTGAPAPRRTRTVIVHVF